jgi:hypothetical protein
VYCIVIKKVAETERAVEYSFEASEAGTPGLLRLDKATGEITEVRPIAGGAMTQPGYKWSSWHSPEKYFPRAARKVAEAWQRGELPETLMWAS